MEIMIVFISFYKYNNNLLYLIFYGYFYSIFHVCHKHWEIREMRYFGLHAIPMLIIVQRQSLPYAI